MTAGAMVTRIFLGSPANARLPRAFIVQYVTCREPLVLLYKGQPSTSLSFRAIRQRQAD
jgi:hypothetical protein